MAECPRSCDTFVCLPERTKDGVMIFGKNSDRPSDEVQEIVYYPHQLFHANDKNRLKCTYIEIDQVSEIASVILSKPSWMWGAEMGSNSHGVCIGNEAVWGKMEPETKEKLLGMDLVRLGLERGKSARDALDIITNLLEVHGQGGPCSDTGDMFYQNSFLIVDFREAWVLETSGVHWAAERVESGYRNISNCYSIGTKMDLMSEGIKEEAIKLGYWNGRGEFNFTKVFGGTECSGRFKSGRDLLAKYSEAKAFDTKAMMAVLRDEEINFGGYEGGFATTSSQVSVIKESGPSAHFFTGTPDSLHSVFKPFIFLEAVPTSATKFTASPNPTPNSDSDYRHSLYRIHEQAYPKIERNKGLQRQMQELEESLLNQVQDALNSPDNLGDKFSDIFNTAANAEMKIYETKPGS